MGFEPITYMDHEVRLCYPSTDEMLLFNRLSGWKPFSRKVKLDGGGLCLVWFWLVRVLGLVAGLAWYSPTMRV